MNRTRTFAKPKFSKRSICNERLMSLRPLKEKLEQKLALTSTLAATEMKESLTNGHVKGSAAKGAGATGCGHKPPRKLNRKLIGMI